MLPPPFLPISGQHLVRPARASYLSPGRVPRDYQRAAGDVLVVGLEHDEGGGREEREPGRERHGQADEGARLRPPPARKILFLHIDR